MAESKSMFIEEEKNRGASAHDKDHIHALTSHL